MNEEYTSLISLSLYVHYTKSNYDLRAVDLQTSKLKYPVAVCFSNIWKMIYASNPKQKANWKKNFFLKKKLFAYRPTLCLNGGVGVTKINILHRLQIKKNILPTYLPNLEGKGWVSANKEYFNGGLGVLFQTAELWNSSLVLCELIVFISSQCMAWLTPNYTCRCTFYICFIFLWNITYIYA